mmetsp:Transcript_1766/g.4036  ORF Transcript_1766/g.4036 Transcript_1766/m.4036 type:complete len:337 (-) Transcript_1766:1511-2521(-)
MSRAARWKLAPSSALGPRVLVVQVQPRRAPCTLGRGPVHQHRILLVRRDRRKHCLRVRRNKVVHSHSAEQRHRVSRLGLLDQDHHADLGRLSAPAAHEHLEERKVLLVRLQREHNCLERVSDVEHVLDPDGLHVAKHNAAREQHVERVVARHGVQRGVASHHRVVLLGPVAGRPERLPALPRHVFHAQHRAWLDVLREVVRRGRELNRRSLALSSQRLHRIRLEDPPEALAGHLVRQLRHRDGHDRGSAVGVPLHRALLEVGHDERHGREVVLVVQHQGRHVNDLLLVRREILFPEAIRPLDDLVADDAGLLDSAREHRDAPALLEQRERDRLGLG